MPDSDKSIPQVPVAKAVPKKRTRLSLVWLIPLVAAATGVWVTATRILSKGPVITIEFSSAEGLEAKKTKVNFNGLTIGTITALRLAENHKTVIATAELDPKAKDFLVKDTKFWVVRPRISGFNITGLGTLISGHYIGVQLGQSRESARHFVSSEIPPRPDDGPGKLFTLKTPQLGSLGEGTPIFFRQLKAGQVVSYELDQAGQALNVKVFVQAPYDQFVTPDTRFWQASGIDVSISAGGLQVRTESVMSILAGGIAFETPVADVSQPPAAPNTEFTLFAGHDAAFRPPPHKPQTYLLVFKQSIRGLSVGAPVQMGGVTIGEVVKISPVFDPRTAEFSVPVTVTLDPVRYGVKFMEESTGEEAVAARKKAVDALVSRGLRAELKTGNLLSGAMYVSMGFFPKEPPVALDWTQTPVALPTKSSKLDAIEDSVASLITNLNVAVVGVHGTLTNLNTVLDSANKLIEPNSPVVRNLDTALVGANRTLTNLNTVLGSANKLIEPNSALDTELNNMLRQGSGAARSLRELADYLERHPEALIRGKPGQPK